MKTRRIHLNPGEAVEVINPYGTSMLKAVAMFEREQPVAVVYEQPDVPIFNPAERKEAHLTNEPVTRIVLKDTLQDRIEEDHS